MNSADLSVNSTPSILVIGDGGTQKTRFLAGCPSPYVFDFDAGMQSTREFAVDYDTFKDVPWREQGKKTAIAKERGFYGWGESWPRFIDHLNDKIWTPLEAGTFGHSTIGLDSFTTLANQSMNYVLKSDGKTGAIGPAVQHWGAQLRLLESVIEQLAAWPLRLVVTAHIKRDDNLVMGTTEYLPLVGGQLSGKIGIYFDEVYYMDKSKEGKPIFRTTSAGLYKMAKSRHGVPDGTEAKWSAIEKYFQPGGGK